MSSERSRWRWTASALGFTLLGAATATLTIYILTARAQADLRPWHRIELAEELEASPEVDQWTLQNYLDLEDRLFEEVERRLASRGNRGGSLTRFNPASPTNPVRFEPNFNRTFELQATPQLGGALLLHGLSDSPYSVRPVAEILSGRGFYSLALRIPGHGTLPAALATTDWKDWRSAVALGARAVLGRLAPDQPFVIVGYSNGAALALDYTLAALENDSLRAPDRLVFLSPALSVSPMAALARWQRLMSYLPGLEKLGWTSVLKEHDPFKYNSFALNAAEQIYELTRHIERRLGAWSELGRAAEFPPVLTIQSVVDATVPPISSLTRLYGRLEANGSELVLFDVNRAAESVAFLNPGVDELLRQADPGRPRPFDVTVITNRDRASQEVVAHTIRAETGFRAVEDLGLEWPRGVYSLSHVAIPFPPDDPIYGIGEGRFPFPLGRLDPRGERGALQLPMDLLMRLRYNPFFSYLEARVAQFVGGGA